MAANRREFLLGVATFAASTSCSPSLAPGVRERRYFGFGEDCQCSLAVSCRIRWWCADESPFAEDAFPTNYVATGQKLGHVEIAWRRPNGPWQKFHSAEATAAKGFCEAYRARDDRGEALGVTVRLEPQGSVLRWTIALSNLSSIRSRSAMWPFRCRCTRASMAKNLRLPRF